MLHAFRGAVTVLCLNRIQQILKYVNNNDGKKAGCRPQDNGHDQGHSQPRKTLRYSGKYWLEGASCTEDFLHAHPLLSISSHTELSGPGSN
jgi:hypothetical protein